MNKILKTISAASFLGMVMAFAGCGGGGDDTTPIIPITPGLVQPIEVSLDGKGSAEVAATLSADAKNNFNDSAATGNNVIITGFGADDQIVITGATAAQYDTVISSDANGTVFISFNSGSATSAIALPGAIPAPVGSKFVSSVAAFNALAVGDIIFK